MTLIYTVIIRILNDLIFQTDFMLNDLPVIFSCALMVVSFPVVLVRWELSAVTSLLSSFV